MTSDVRRMKDNSSGKNVQTRQKLANKKKVFVVMLG